MATLNRTPGTNTYTSDSEDGQANGGRRGVGGLVPSMPQTSFSSAPNVNGGGSSLAQPPGQLLKGIVDGEGKLKDPALLIGIKLDLEAEIHLTARIKGDITIGLY